MDTDFRMDTDQDSLFAFLMRRDLYRQPPSESESMIGQESPEPSGWSVKSSRSIMDPPVFAGEPGPAETKQRLGQESPEPSGLSLKSSRSIMDPPGFAREPAPKAFISMIRRSHRKESPEPSGLSVKSSRSIMDPPVFAGEPGPAETKQRLGQESPEPSGWSLRSSRSIMDPPVFAREPAPKAIISMIRRSHRKESPEPSGLSVKSSRSIMDPPVFAGEPGPAETKQRLRQESPEPSVWSLRSSRSIMDPPVFAREPATKGTKQESPEPSGVSMKSDWSKSQPPFFAIEPKTKPEFQGPRGRFVKSGWSTEATPAFSGEPGPSETKERLGVPSEEQKSGQECGPYTGLQTFTDQTDLGLQQVLEEHKLHLRRRCEHVTEGAEGTGSRTLLNRIYTELYITEGLSDEVITQHELRHLETPSTVKKMRLDTTIRCCDIFKALPEQQRNIRVVLTRGVAGVGKTFSVLKFTLDWAQGLENQDVELVVLLSFRELNLIRGQQLSLLQLLHVFHPTLEAITAEELRVYKLLFILDGLDESRLSLDFSCRTVLTEVTQSSSVGVVLSNLIQGNLLPSAHIWITSRPAAANQIPPTCVDRVTEVRGFTDVQKDQYFRKRFTDEELSSRIISHITASSSLRIMCGIPLFCWISATVLEHMLNTEQRGELPQTLTDLYSHFLLVQAQRNKRKYSVGDQTSPHELTETDREVLLRLGRLAFEHLEKGNVIFYQEDLEQCGLDVTEASVYSGVCTEIFRPESVIFNQTVYCFVHLSIQEFLAAVYAFHCYTTRKVEVLQVFLGEDPVVKAAAKKPFWYFGCKDSWTLEAFLEQALEKSLQNEKGHLDLFVRFLHGLSLESNRRLLGDLLGQTQNRPDTTQTVIRNLKRKNTSKISPDRSINIFHCLTEMKDEEIQVFLKSRRRSAELSRIQSSALAYMMQMSEEVLDELDLEQYKASPEGRWRLIPAVRNCRKARLTACGFTEVHCEIVASALNSSSSQLRELDISDNVLQDSGVRVLCKGLASPHCRLETLRLKGCELSDVSCISLFEALKSNPVHLRELDLSHNQLQLSGVEALCDFLESPQCQLESLRLIGCGLSDISFKALVWALRSNPTQLTELDLSHNCLEDEGFDMMCDPFIQRCQLESLGFANCSLSRDSCYSLALALKTNPPHLRHLDLRGNQLLDAGVMELSGFLQSSDCRLETLRLWSCGLTEVSCEALVSALRKNSHHLKELELSENCLQDAGVEALSELLSSPRCRLQTLRLSTCSLTKTSCDLLASALRSNPAHLRDLNLTYNQLQRSDLDQLFQLQTSDECQLTTLRWNDE